MLKSKPYGKISGYSRIPIVGWRRTNAMCCGLIPATDRSLREVALGGWEGLRRDEAAARFPAEYTAWAADTDVRRGGGETQAEAGARVAAALIGFLWRAGLSGTIPPETFLVASPGEPPRHHFSQQKETF